MSWNGPAEGTDDPRPCAFVGALSASLHTKSHRFAVCLHTHRRMVRRFSPDLCAMDPGSLTERVTGTRPH